MGRQDLGPRATAISKRGVLNLDRKGAVKFFSVLVVALISSHVLVSCASSPGVEVPQTSEENSATSWYAESDGEDRPVRDRDHRSSQHVDPARHWWGQIQQRADLAYAELQTEIADCLEGLGESSQVREMALKARQSDRPDVGYELVDVVTHPESGVEERCVEELSQDFVDAVDTAFWDAFDTYIATFIHRGDLITECDEGGDQNAVCLDLDVQSPADSVDSGHASGCDDELVDAVNAAMRQGRPCWSPSQFLERAEYFGDQPIQMRAVLFGHLSVNDGGARVVLRHNQPWVESMARCVVDEVAAAGLDVQWSEKRCTATLRNRSVTYWNRPVFTYIEDGETE